MAINNLTRSVLPKISKIGKENIKYINEMPEMVLTCAKRSGDKSIVQVGMNECVAARISEGGINTVFTDSLSGCNAVGVVAKALDGKPVVILSHYTPLPESRRLQCEALNKQLSTYDYYLDKTTKPDVFFNVRGYTDESGVLKPQPNQIFDEIRNVLNKFFKQGFTETITPYQNVKRPAFFSSANIFQFDSKNLNKLKITNVGEKERFLDLKY